MDYIGVKKVGDDVIFVMLSSPCPLFYALAKLCKGQMLKEEEEEEMKKRNWSLLALSRLWMKLLQSPDS